MTTRLAMLAAGATAAMAVLAAPAATAATMPFSGSFTKGGGSGPQPGGRCSPASTITWDPVLYPADYTSNYGDFTRSGDECVVPPQPTTSFDGTFTMDFGGGTTLSGTRISQGFATATPFVFDLFGYWTITSGTGLFADAIGGKITETAILSPPFALNVYAGRLDGFIVTPAPGAMALFGLSLAGLAAVRRRMARTR